MSKSLLLSFLKPTVLADAAYKSSASAWFEHIPFAFWCVDALRPRTFVELGTHQGDSYCAFCQAVEAIRTQVRCFAVDTWQGDAHTGSYGDEILEHLRKIHDPRYGAFSELLRCTFDEANSKFEDGTIDLLHIDGLHTYEAVKHDFDTWLPKMSTRGVVLFHDTNVHMRDFGVWKLWKELSQDYPHFEFLHGSGLGVLAVGPDVPEPMRELCGLPESEMAAVRAIFARLGWGISLSSELDALVAERNTTGARMGRFITRLGNRFAPAGTLRRRLASLAVRGLLRLLPRNA